MGPMPTESAATQRYRDAFAYRDLVSELEALIDRAWPALTVLDVDGWRVRSARGFTRLVNSVWPRESRGALELSARIDRVERVYAQRGMTPCFWLSPSATPRGLDRALADRGYEATPPVEVCTTAIDVLADLDGVEGEVTLLDSPAARWLDAWTRLSGASAHEADTAAALLERVRAEQAYAVVSRDETDVGVARGVLHGGWLGIDYLAAAESARTDATGHALVGALGRWARDRGGQRAYSQLDRADACVSALTRGMRWRRAYTYRFRVHPLPPRSAPPGRRAGGQGR